MVINPQAFPNISLNLTKPALSQESSTSGSVLTVGWDLSENSCKAPKHLSPMEEEEIELPGLRNKTQPRALCDSQSSRLHLCPCHSTPSGAGWHPRAGRWYRGHWRHYCSAELDCSPKGVENAHQLGTKQKDSTVRRKAKEEGSGASPLL